MESRRCIEASQTNSFCTSKSFADVIVIDDSDNREVTSAVDALINSVGLVDGTYGPTSSDSMTIKAGGRAEVRDVPCDYV